MKKEYEIGDVKYTFIINAMLGFKEVTKIVVKYNSECTAFEKQLKDIVSFNAPIEELRISWINDWEIVKERWNGSRWISIANKNIEEL